MTRRERTDAEIAAEVATWPPFTPERAERLALLWRPGVIAAHKARRTREAAARKGGATRATT